METTNRIKKHLVCDDIEDLVVGDVLVWDNTTGGPDCEVTGCRPALEKARYSIPAGQTKDANVVAKSTQHYHCRRGDEGKEADPKLIVR